MGSRRFFFLQRRGGGLRLVVRFPQLQRRREQNLEGIPQFFGSEVEVQLDQMVGAAVHPRLTDVVFIRQCEDGLRRAAVLVQLVRRFQEETVVVGTGDAHHGRGGSGGEESERRRRQSSALAAAFSAVSAAIAANATAAASSGSWPAGPIPKVGVDAWHAWCLRAREGRLSL